MTQTSTISDKSLPVTGITLTGLRVSGHGKQAGEILLRPGLNVITGASDTGKSHILECVDFLFGARTVPERFPENDGFTELYLGIKGRSRNEVTLRRAFGGGDVSLYESTFSAVDQAVPAGTLKAVHDSGSRDNVSVFLLGLTGLEGRRIRKNSRGVTRSLSFRDIASLCLVSEGEMFRKGSPVLSDNKTDNPVEKAVFFLMLTGADDSALVAAPDPKQKKLQVQAQIDLITQLIDERQQSLQAMSVRQEFIAEKLRSTDALIASATASVSTLQSEIATAEAERQQAYQRLKPVESRTLMLRELLARFELLDRHYSSDAQRLEAMLEVRQAFATTEPKACPLCEAVPFGANSGKQPADADLDAFADACQTEMAKVHILKADLATTREQLTEELIALEAEGSRLRQLLASASRQIEEILQPRVLASESGLRELIAVRAEFAKAASIHEEILQLRDRRQLLERKLKEKRSKEEARTHEDLGAIEQFCKIVEQLLREWRYPNLDRVTFDNRRFDLIVNGRARGSQGKGYRALTRAAFNIGVMRYCREHGLPHPGVIILDSPLVTLREPDKDTAQPTSASQKGSVPSLPPAEEGEVITGDMKDAFYESLRSDPYGDQIIVLENDDPADGLRDKINFIHFSKVKGVGRYGFYPVA